MAGVTRSPFGLPEGDQQVQTPGLVHRPLRHRLEFEGLAVVGHRFVVGQLGKGAVAGLSGVTTALSVSALGAAARE